MNCRSCDQNVTEKYCGHCGAPVVLKRVDGHYIFHEIQHVLHFEKGILYTIKALLFQPGKSIRHFIAEDRSRLVKPVIFLIITSLIYTFIAHFFHLEKTQAVAGAPAHSSIVTIMTWIEGHYGYANIIMGIFIGLWLKLLYRKSAYNFFELLIMLCFVMGTGMLVFAVFTLIEGITGSDLLVVTSIVMLIYSVWAIGQFLNGKKFIDYLVALAAYVLGWFSFSLLAALLGVLMDLCRKA